jgi:alpha-L-fucosidase 2
MMTTTTSFDPFARAAEHTISLDRPTRNFFEGALLGNGGLGAVVTTRPDAIAIHFGHNSVWDIRVAEDHKDEVGTFAEVFEKVKAIPSDLKVLDDDPWYHDYRLKMESNYRKPYPRPFPCGTFVIGFDRRHVQVLGHALFIETGLCEVSLLADGVPCTLQVFTDMQADRLWLRLVDADGEPMASPFDRVRLIPDPDTFSSRFVADGAVAGMPHPAPVEGLPQGSLAFRQVLPYQVPEQYDLAAGHPKDRAFCLSLSVIQPLEHRVRENTVSGVPKPMDDLERGLVSPEHPERMSAAQRRPQSKDAGFVACVQLDHGLASDVTGPADLPAATAEGYDAARDDAAGSWEDYWRRSGVKLSDRELERAWYRNLYFLNCAVRTGVTCPGLFANWSYKNIGTAWHGDYHMNYNTQQPFWVTFSSNHVDKHLPYVDLVDFLRPISRQWARDYYGMRGAFFPHSAYPVDMTMFPYPVPTWGWEVCETPWTVQSLWWHYLYTQDRDFLAARAFEPIKESVLFLVDYMTRPEAHGAGWGDDRYHVFPTVSPELYGLTPGFRMNRDCIADLTLIRFVFNAYLEACDILGLADAEAETVAAVREILRASPSIPPRNRSAAPCGCPCRASTLRSSTTARRAPCPSSPARRWGSARHANSTSWPRRPIATRATRAATTWSSSTCRAHGSVCWTSTASAASCATACCPTARTRTWRCRRWAATRTPRRLTSWSTWASGSRTSRCRSSSTSACCRATTARCACSPTGGWTSGRSSTRCVRWAPSWSAQPARTGRCSGSASRARPARR